MSKSSWLSVKEAAVRLDRTEETVRRQARAGQLPAAKSSDGPKAAWLIRGPVLEEQIKRGLNKPPTSGFGEVGTEAVVLAAGMASGWTVPEIEAAIRARQEELARRGEAEEVMQGLSAEERLRLNLLDIAELDAIDAEASIEPRAQQLAERIRIQRRIIARAEQILENDDEE